MCVSVSAYCSFYKTNCIKQSIEIELIPNYVMSLELFKQKQINNTKKKKGQIGRLLTVDRRGKKRYPSHCRVCLPKKSKNNM